MRTWERDVFWRDDLLVDGYIFGDIISWELLGDFGGDRELGDSQGQGLVEFVEGGSDGGNVGEEF